LYALEATDFHHENLIAAGEHPILIDQEAFFHPRIEGTDLPAEERLGMQAMNFSVLRVGLLPLQILLNEELEGIDISGIGGHEGQQTPWPVPQWQDNDTDQMRLIRKKSTMIGTNNRPTLNSTDIDPLAYREDLLRGFTQMYRLLMVQREALLAGPLEKFAHDEIRLILRPTQMYAELLFEGSHPDVLRDALNRDRFFDHLWALIEHCPYLARAIPYERRDLHMGDVPIFLTTPSTRDVFTSHGEILTDFLAEPSFISAQQRVQNLDGPDLQRQIWLIEASLATLEMGNPHAARKFSALEPTDTKASGEQLLTAACTVGDRISELALRNAEHVSWLGLSLVNERRWALLPVGLDLYDGIYGIILFLSYLGAVSHKEDYTVLARQAFYSYTKQLEQAKKTLKRIGAFDGWSARIYLLTHLGSLWHEPTLWNEAEELVDLLPELIPQDQKKDIISGAAGCLLVLLSLYQVRPT
ncbi:MAG: type 2 lanthipeptide synthetase LanM, partial [Ktedonobacteraceae bacterium]